MSESGRERRLGGAIGLSVACHGLLFALLLLALAWQPRHVLEPPPPVSPLDIVWLVEPGPGGGGGGGGGGDDRPEPPSAVEEPGDDPLTVPVEEAPAPDSEPEPEPDPEPEIDPEPPPLRVDVPARTMAAALTSVPGAIVPDDVSGAVGQGRGSGAGGGNGDGLGPGDGPGLGAGDDGGAGGGPRGPGSGVTDPVALRQVEPMYTAEALRARIQGSVWVQCIVRPTGVCTDLRVVRSLDPRFGLDDEAVRAASQWRFAPATRGGEPVPVQVVIQLDFALR